jgi:hypothetical protein
MEQMPKEIGAATISEIYFGISSSPATAEILGWNRHISRWEDIVTTKFGLDQYSQTCDR